MLVKVLRPFMQGGGIIATEGKVINLSDARAKELEKKGLVVPTLGGKGRVEDAFPQRQDGGGTGAEKVAPSLPPVQQPLTSENILKKPKKKRKSSR